MPNRRRHEIAGKRKKTRNMVPYGWGVKIAKRAGVSPQSLCSYWNGVGNNEAIRKAIQWALAEIIADEKNIDELDDTLKNLRIKKSK